MLALKLELGWELRTSRTAVACKKGDELVRVDAKLERAEHYFLGGIHRSVKPNACTSFNFMLQHV